MARGKPHSPEVKARALAMLAAGQSMTSVAHELGIDLSVISRWAPAVATQMQVIATKRSEDFTELLQAFMLTALRALTTQAEVMCDPDWIRKYEPDKLAIAYGVLGDKLAGLATTAQALGLVAPAQTPDRALPAPDDECNA